MTNDERDFLYRKLGPRLIEQDPDVSNAFNRIAYNDEDLGDVLVETIKTLAERLQIAEDALLLDKLKAEVGDLNGPIRLNDLVRVLRCCACKSCAPFKDKIARVRESQFESDWLKAQPGVKGGEEPLLRLALTNHTTHCCVRVSQVRLIARAGSARAVKGPDSK